MFVALLGGGGKLRDESKLAYFQAGSGDLLSELGEVVLVGVADLLDDAVKAQSLEQS